MFIFGYFFVIVYDFAKDFAPLWGQDRRNRMKKKDWVSIMLIVVCLGVLMGYRTLNKLSSDSKAPVITMEGQLPELSVYAPRETLLTGVTARDEVDGDVTASLVVESIRLLREDGRISVTYAAFDKAGNVAKESRELRYTDYRSPRFDLTRPLLFTQGKNYDVISLITAEDTLDGDITHRIRATVLEDVDTEYQGSYHVRFQVTNSLSETVELTLPVEVWGPNVQMGELLLTDYLVYLNQGDRFDPKEYLKSVTVGREEISLGHGVPEDLKLTVTGTVQTGMPGVYAVDYRISYREEKNLPGGNDIGYSRLIVVVEG